MSISKMKKLAVFAHKDELDAIVKRLMRLRCVDISTHTDRDEEEELELERISCDARRLELESTVADIDAVIAALDPHVKRAKGMLAGKKKLNTDEFVQKGNADKARKVVSRTLQILGRREAIKTESAETTAELVSARPYTAFDLPLGFDGTETTECFLGVLPAATDLEASGKELFRTGAIANLLGNDKNGIYAAYFCHRKDSSAVSALLSSYGFLRASFQGVELTAKELVRSSQRKLKALAEEDAKLFEELKSLANYVDAVEVLYDIEATELAAINQKSKLVATESVAIISAWIPAGREAVVTAALDKLECAYDVSEPDGEDVPPILLKNNGFATNFEWVLGMYSYPQYGRFDPTFIMSIFYFVIFGIMFADVGYGLIVALGCLAAVKLLKLSDGLKRSLTMFGYCGISCIVFGVLFGSYFGDMPIAIMKTMMGIPESELPNLSILPSDSPTLALLLDPLQDPMGFLIFSLAVGAIHLIAGMAVKFVILCKDGHVWDAIFDIGAYWVLFAGFGLLAIVPEVGKWVAIAGAVFIVLTHGRDAKNIFMKLAKGLLGLYDLINYGSDLLSYSRILALGLSAGIIAQVVNLLGTMGGPTVGGFIMMAFVFVIGHVLNLAINMLGTFVHASRLQYIEFFGKFYEDGGTPFEPALSSEKYTEHQE
ncbi:MAG: V-type ATP synthase subunit I [Clostridia bacterium]|nr:V-type ATP synthase subunit I [Clostridia bacterium]